MAKRWEVVIFSDECPYILGEEFCMLLEDYYSDSLVNSLCCKENCPQAYKLLYNFRDAYHQLMSFIHYYSTEGKTAHDLKSEIREKYEEIAGEVFDEQ